MDIISDFRNMSLNEILESGRQTPRITFRTHQLDGTPLKPKNSSLPQQANQSLLDRVGRCIHDLRAWDDFEVFSNQSGERITLKDVRAPKSPPLEITTRDDIISKLAQIRRIVRRNDINEELYVQGGSNTSVAWIRGQELLMTYSKTPENTKSIQTGDPSLIDSILSSETCGPTRASDDDNCFYEEIRKLQFMILEANGQPIPKGSGGWPTITTDQEVLEKVQGCIERLKAEEDFNIELAGLQIVVHDVRAPENPSLVISKDTHFKAKKARMKRIVRRNKINKKLKKIEEGKFFVAWIDDEKIKITYSKKRKHIRTLRNGNPEAIVKAIHRQDYGATITTNDNKSIRDVIERVKKLQDMGLDD